MPITLGILDLGRAVFHHSQLTNAVREGARYGKIDPNNGAKIDARVREYTGGLAVTTVTTTRSASPCDPGRCNVTVRADARFDMITEGFLNSMLGGAIPGSFTISSSATVLVE